jgi:hypothetical protein
MIRTPHYFACLRDQTKLADIHLKVLWAYFAKYNTSTIVPFVITPKDVYSGD